MSEYGSVTQCPHCKTSFHVGPIQLEAAGGHVRCGGCLKVFDAHEHFVIEQKPLFSGVTETSQPDIDKEITTTDQEYQQDTKEASEDDSTEPSSIIENAASFVDVPESAEDDLISIVPVKLFDDQDLISDIEVYADSGSEPEHEAEDEDEKAIADNANKDTELLDTAIDNATDSATESYTSDEQEIDTLETEAESLDKIETEISDSLEQEDSEPESGEVGSESESEKAFTSHKENQLAADDTEEKEIDILDRAFEELEADLAEPEETNSLSDDEKWQPMIAERTGANAEEPVLSDRAEVDEEEELAEQLFVDFEKNKKARKPSAIWIGCVSLLLIALFAQSLYWQPASLRQNNFYNQVSLNYCAVLPCRQEILQDLSQLYITGLVRPSDEYNNALSVQVELRNRAEQPQRFPHIELAFTDLRGEKISLRRFSPEEYLRAETVGRTVLEPFQRVQIEMELYDPGASAISYAFDLLYIN